MTDLNLKFHCRPIFGFDLGVFGQQRWMQTQESGPALELWDHVVYHRKHHAQYNGHDSCPATCSLQHATNWRACD